MLTWKVFVEDINTKEIKRYDIFKGGRFEAIAKEIKDSGCSKDEFAYHFRTHLMSQFWSRCEYEVIITSWPAYIDTKELERLQNEAAEYEKRYGMAPTLLNCRLKVSQKIDVFEQLCLNWDHFIDYVYKNV